MVISTIVKAPERNLWSSLRQRKKARRATGYVVSGSHPKDAWIVMSNQGMDCFLDLLITAADVFEKTEHQKKLISFLKDQKGISCIRMGTINRKRLY